MRSWSIVLPNDLPAATPLPLLLIEAWSALAEWALLVKTSLQHCSRPRGHSDCDCKKKPSLRSSLLECVNCADCNHHQRPFSALKLIGWSRSMYLHQSGYYWLKAELNLALLTKCQALTTKFFSREPIQSPIPSEEILTNKGLVSSASATTLFTGDQTLFHASEKAIKVIFHNALPAGYPRNWWGKEELVAPLEAPPAPESTGWWPAPEAAGVNNWLDHQIIKAAGGGWFTQVLGDTRCTCVLVPLDTSRCHQIPASVRCWWLVLPGSLLCLECRSGVLIWYDLFFALPNLKKRYGVPAGVSGLVSRRIADCLKWCPSYLVCLKWCPG